MISEEILGWHISFLSRNVLEMIVKVLPLWYVYSRVDAKLLFRHHQPINTAYTSVTIPDVILGGENQLGSFCPHYRKKEYTNVDKETIVFQYLMLF